MSVACNTKDKMKRAALDKVEELLSSPIIDAKIQININRGEVPTIRYDITEVIMPEEGGKDEMPEV